MTADMKKRGLGRGLDALFQDARKEEEAFEPKLRRGSEIPEAPYETKSAPQPPAGASLPRRLPVERLTPGKFQPRQFFDEDALEQLADSIKSHGILQPLLVRPLSSGLYEIIAGERRWRAAQLAQVHEVPVIIQDLTDKDALEIGLIENLQREDLTAIEEAEGYQRLIDDFGYTQEQLSDHLGKSRPHVTNMLRLLKLPADVRHLVQTGQLSAGHARALIGVKNASELAGRIVARGYSVRQAEALVNQSQGHEDLMPKRRKNFVQKDADILALEAIVTNKLGLRVRIEGDGQEGLLVIEYKNLDQLDDVLARLGYPPKRA